MKKFANIIVEVSTKSLDKPFTYFIPRQFRELIDIGSIVTISFGKGDRIIKGYVVDFLEEIDFDENKLKSIIDVNEDISIETKLIKLAYWMKERYLCTIQSALKAMIPSSEKINKKYHQTIKRNITNDELMSLIDDISDNPRFHLRKTALQYLIKHEYVEKKKFLSETGISNAILNGLIKKNIVRIIEEEVSRQAYDINKIDVTSNLKPNENQKKAINLISDAVNNKNTDIFLLHGITGSGKTEVYMQVIENVIKNNEQAIVLIPEIALTPQTVYRFVGRFGDTVGILHSKLSMGEKYEQWLKAKEGKISIMIGPRSAIFTPFENLGIIIIDEEHEMTYKSEMPPKFHAREVAIKRGDMHQCPVVLGTATPLIETYYKALKGKYKLLELKDKANKESSLNVELIDMREELLNGNKSFISASLKVGIEEALEKKEQVILFLNRRGYSQFVSCRKCGYVVKCSSCDIPYTYHASNNRLICHYCGKSITKIKECPSCGSRYIKEFGIGTQKVEDYIKKTFPQAKVLRMDLDTTSKKNSYEAILEQFNDHKADILIGTQMIAKGHHFENVTLVGVIAADLSLYLNDFRAAERTFQLVTQVTGRTGRGFKKGRALIQTYSNEHYSLITSKEQDYVGFYNNEIQFREIMMYPPFSNILILLLNSRDEKRLVSDSYKIKRIIDNHYQQLDILGPAPANISKIKNVFRWRIIIKSKNYNQLVQITKFIYKNINENQEFNHINLQFDLNPMISY